MVFDWEIGRVIEFHNTLEQFKGTNNQEDQMVWLGNKEGKFTVKSAYKEYNLQTIW
ncbi:hypothetical protein MTR67_037912 [Solanum verrucosum]|uniref:Uncharacterized protein n=1 Tax=Solanum verrucosum TaxID=315347 RepID=A0AAF0UEH2_SOLVR|nr:hypothetical protein MTR67_037912 [Solanum verrucosum]